MRIDMQQQRIKYLRRKVLFLTAGGLLILFFIFTVKSCITVPGSVSANAVVNTDSEKDEHIIQTFSPTPESTSTPSPTPSPSPKIKKKVLIYCTHNDEAYFKGSKKYSETVKGRTMNNQYNVIAVASHFGEFMQKNGFDVTVDKSDNVTAGFNDAYDTAYKNIKEYINKKDIYIDVHRDAYDNTFPNYAQKNGREYAYIKLVVTNGTNFDIRPNFNENYANAKALKEQINTIFPGLCTEIVIKNKRFNQHISKNCFLVEIGNEKNDIEQVKASSEILARAFEIFLT